MLTIPNHEAVSVISEVRTNGMKLHCSPLKMSLLMEAFHWLKGHEGKKKSLHGCTSDFNKFWNEKYTYS